MRKFYTIVIAAAMSLGASFSAFAAVPHAPKPSVSDEAAQKLSVKELAVQKTEYAVKGAQPKTDDETWVKKSTGIWFEGPLASRFSNVSKGEWDVDIYECESKPGWIRLNPYTAETQPAKILGAPNTVYLEINIQNPQKCWFPDWAMFGVFTYGSLCPENEWPATYNSYGTITDGILTFGPEDFAYESGGQWSMGNCEIKIVLDKTQYVDYTVNTQAPFCSDVEGQYFAYTKTDAVTTVKLMVTDGVYPMNDQNANIVKNNGTDVTSYAGKKVNFGLDPAREAYTYLYVGMDVDGNIRAQGAVISYILQDDAENWKEIGEATYTEGVLSSLFNDVESEDMKCKIQENIAKPGYYRLVNPYDNHSKGFKSDHGHNHYIYINATDPDHVYVEPSVMGAYVPGFGDFACESWGYKYLDRVEEGENSGVWGKLNDNKITVPQFRTHISDYNNALMMSLYDSQNPSTFAVKLPTQSGISNVAADEASVAPVYYNLQGVRVDEPRNGLFIEVRGNKAAKVCK
ncbi:MAG: hypothetical protein K2M07_00665 [Muribaculaceae bacterium]|nr:hypothetical protein [Muribaculaceae bacterium]